MGLALGSKGGGGDDQLRLETFDPSTAALVQRAHYPVLDGDPTAPVEGVAHAPSGVVAISYTLYEERAGEYLLFTSVQNPEAYQVIELPWDAEQVPGTRGLAWDGEAFVWHGLLLDEQGESVLAIARFDEAGGEVLPLTVVGRPSSAIWDSYDMVTDPRSGTTWMTSAGGGGARVTGTLRDGTPLVPLGDLPPVLAANAIYPSNTAHVALGEGGNAMFTFHCGDDGFFAQLADSNLEPLGDPMHIAREVFVDLRFRFSENAAAYRAPEWWLFANNGLALTAYRTVDGATVADSFELIHYPAREAYLETGLLKNPDQLMQLDNMSTDVYEDEIWVGLFDESADQLGGRRARYRVLRVVPGCSYPSQYEREIAAML